MALPTFNPPVRPGPGFPVKPELSLNQVSFGDGYTLASPNGLNHIRQTVTLSWEGLTQAQKTAIETFLFARGGYKPFLYKPYGFSQALRWICAEWSGSHGAPFTFTATLKQDFSNAS